MMMSILKNCIIRIIDFLQGIGMKLITMIITIIRIKFNGF